MFGLYIHIPFCNSICTYCDFPKRIAQNSTMKENYINTLIKELNQNNREFDRINTIYIGGGTPNSLELKDLEKLLVYLNKNINFNNIVEFTIELNPELITIDLAKLLYKYHVTRVSIGVQTFNNKLLEKVNRKHTLEDVFDSVKLLYNIGIKNINLDLIFNLPDQKIKDIKFDLKMIKKLKKYINHISYYSLIIEEKSVLYQKNPNIINEIDNDKEYKMMKIINKKLPKLGYFQYEISNFSRKNFESKHNIIYWKNEQYLGIGAGASGYFNNIRYSNTRNISKYIDNFDTIKDEEFVDLDNKLIYEMILGLRLIEGININDVNLKYNIDIMNRFNIEKLIKNDLLLIENSQLKLTKKGLFLANIVFEEFV